LAALDNVNGEQRVLTLQANSRVGVTASAPVSRRQSLKISYSDGSSCALAASSKPCQSAGSTRGSAFRFRFRRVTMDKDRYLFTGFNV
jgi:hypothetical protein